MTTNTSSHRPCNWTAAFADSLRRNRALLIFSFLLLLSAPLQSLLENAGSGSGLESIFAVLEASVPILLSVVVPFIVFNYLHSRRAIDLYHALPIKRASLFIGKYLSGLVLVLAPTLLGYGLAWLTEALANGSIGPLMTDTVSTLSRLAPCVLPETVMLYTFVVFMVVCCGTVWETIMYGGGLSLALLGICYGVPELVDQLYGYFYGSTDLSEWLMAFTPFYFFGYQTRYSYSYLSPVPYYQMVFPVLITIGLFCAALFLYQNRKSESTGSAFAFRFLFHLVSIFISFSLILSLYVLNSDLVSALMLGFIVYFVMSVIANRGFRRLLPVFARSAGILAVSAAFILSFQQTGGYGFENRVPALEDIETVYLSPISVGDAQTTESYGFVAQLSRNGYYSKPPGAKNEVRINGYQEEANIRLVREIHQNLVNIRPVDGHYVRLQIIYRLKNGETLRRSYYQVTEADFQRLAALNETEEYLKLKYPFMREGYSYGTKASAAIINPLDSGSGSTIFETLDVSADEVAKAIRADIEARPPGFEVAPDAAFLGRIGFYDGNKKLNGKWADWSDADVVNIYDCDKNILSLLEKRDKLDTLTGSMQRYTVAESVYVAPKSLYTGGLPDLFKISNSYRYKEVGVWYKVTNEADREFLLTHLQPVYYDEEGCDLVGVGEYSYLIPNQYRVQLQDILSRAVIAE